MIEFIHYYFKMMMRLEQVNPVWNTTNLTFEERSQALPFHWSNVSVVKI